MLSVYTRDACRTILQETTEGGLKTPCASTVAARVTVRPTTQPNTCSASPVSQQEMRHNRNTIVNQAKQTTMPNKQHTIVCNCDSLEYAKLLIGTSWEALHPSSSTSVCLRQPAADVRMYMRHCSTYTQDQLQTYQAASRCRRLRIICAADSRTRTIPMMMRVNHSRFFALLHMHSVLLQVACNIVPSQAWYSHMLHSRITQT